jgi:non-ribosomal peptide synthetase component F
VVGRPVGHLAGVAGLCTNTVPLALAIDPERPLSELFATAHEQLLDGIQHGLYPFVRAVETVRPVRDVGRLPLAETAVTVLESPLPEVPGVVGALTGDAVTLELGDLRVRTIPVPRRSCRYDLDLVIAPGRGELRLCLDYSAELFRPETARALLRTYADMVVVAEHAERIGDTFVLSEDDRDVLARFGHCDTSELDPPLIERLRAAAAMRPAAPAVVSATRSVTLADFTARMDRIGAALVDALGEGVDPWRPT